MSVGLAVLFVASCLAAAAPAAARPVKIVAFGDSLSAGYQLPADAAFPAVLERALKSDGFDATVANAGVSGDTASGGLERVQWSVPDGTDLAIVELGANDMLRGFDPAITRTALDAILADLQKRHDRRAAGRHVCRDGARPGPTASTSTPSTRASPGAPPSTLYPFFLAGIIGHPELHLTGWPSPQCRRACEEIVRRTSCRPWRTTLKGMGAKG